MPAARDPSEAPLHVKSLLPNDRFEVISVIGVGTFGGVFRVKDSSTNPPTILALKKIFLDPRYKNRELEIVMKLAHPCCLRYISHYTTVEGDRGQTFLHLVTNCGRMGLPEFIEKHPRPPGIYFQAYGFQIFSALAYIHSHQLAHRDLKPSNILVDPDSGELQLCDFGSAKVLRSAEESVSYIATRSYRAPELLLDCPSYSPAVDVWAAGCILAEMALANRPLFPGGKNDEVMQRIARTLGAPGARDFDSFKHKKLFKFQGGRVVPLEERLPGWVPAGLCRLLGEVLTYDPVKRPSAAQLMSHGFFADVRDGSARLPGGGLLPEYIHRMASAEEMLRTWPSGP